MPLALTILVLVVLAERLDLVLVASTVRAAEAGWIVFAVAAQLLAQIAAARRIRIVTSPGAQHRLLRLTGVEAVSSGASYLLPPGLGEVARAGIWRWASSVPVLRTGTAVVLIRALDVATLGVFVGVAWLMGAFPQSAWMKATAALCTLVGLLAFVALFALAWRGRWMVGQLVRSSSALLGTIAPRWRDKIADRFSQVVSTELEQLRPFQNVAAVVLFTLLYWVADFGLYYGVARALVPDFELVGVFTIFAVAFAAALAPLPGLAGAGSHELGWAGGLLMLGRGKAEALALAAASHLLFIAIVVLAVPALGWCILALTERSAPAVAVAEPGETSAV